MASPSGCDTCGKQPAPNATLKNCAKCHTGQYCSRNCQRADWKQHKKVCSTRASENTAAPASGSAASTTAQPPPPPDNNNANAGAASGTDVKHDYMIDKPFHALDTNTWLHHRPEPHVYALLTDAYRLRVEDEHKFHGHTSSDSLYGAGDKDGALRGFRTFLRNAERCPSAVLPPWWSDEKAEACLAYARNAAGEHDLARHVTKADIQRLYGDESMPMQLRMLAEKIEGMGIMGQDGSALRLVMMRYEAGQGAHFSSMMGTQGDSR